MSLVTIYDQGCTPATPPSCFCSNQKALLLFLCSLPAVLDAHHLFDSNSAVKIESLYGRHSKVAAFRPNFAPSLFPLVASVVRTLNWGIVRTLRFSEVVDVYGFSHSLESFGMLIGVFASAGRYSQVRYLIKCLVDYNKNVGFSLLELPTILPELSSGELSLLQAYGLVIQVLAESSMLDAAVQSYLKAKIFGVHIGVPVCNFLLKSLVKHCEVERAKMLFQNMKNFGPLPNVHTYTILMNLYAKDGMFNIDEASGILKEMEQRGVKPNEVTYGTYIRVLCGAGMIESAREFLKDLLGKGLQYNNYCFNAVILGFCREASLLPRALTVLDEMKACGLTPDVHTYSILIDGFCKKGDVLKGYDLLIEMANSGIMPTIVCYSSLLHGLCMRGEMDTAVNLFYELKYRGYEHDLVSYGILIDGYCHLGDLEGACKLWDEMIQRDLKPDALCYTSTIYGYCKIGCLNEALQQFELMLCSGVAPSVVTCAVIVDGFCKKGHLADAFQFLNEMLGWGVIPNIFIYKVLMIALCEEMPHKTLRGLADYFLECQEKQLSPTFFTYTSLINGLCRNGRFPEALSLFEEMIEKGFTPDRVVYTSVIGGYCRCGDVEKAMKLFNKMVQCDGTITYCSYLYFSYSWYRKMGDWDKAFDMYNRMIKQGIQPDMLANLSLGINRSTEQT
uniref:Pentatricopeptide repeat-containing protein n=1 Tax=Ananas comosus var. bracteatus TaxID=296719 RepID=A0A6V7QLT7_ANACO|nr:unnamed protein product [Ananas comosus var. bracteatus]